MEERGEVQGPGRKAMGSVVLFRNQDLVLINLNRYNAVKKIFAFPGIVEKDLAEIDFLRSCCLRKDPGDEPSFAAEENENAPCQVSIG